MTVTTLAKIKRGHRQERVRLGADLAQVQGDDSEEIDKDLAKLLLRQDKEPCQKHNLVTPSALMQAFAELGVNTERFAWALDRSDHMLVFYSNDDKDRVFGARG